MTTLRRMDRLAATIGPFVSFFEGSFAKWNADPSVASAIEAAGRG